MVLHHWGWEGQRTSQKRRPRGLYPPPSTSVNEFIYPTLEPKSQYLGEKKKYIYIYIHIYMYIYIYLAAPAAYGSSQARDGTCTIGATQAAAVTTPDP